MKPRSKVLLEQFALPISVETELRDKSLTALRDAREALFEELIEKHTKSGPQLQALLRGAPTAQAAALTALLCTTESASARKQIRTLRTLHLYIVARELRECPNASLTEPVGEPVPDATQAALPLSEIHTQTTH